MIQPILDGVVWGAAIALVASALGCAYQDRDQRDLQAAQVAMQAYGCGACHRIPGIHGAVGMVGPPLERFDRRVYIAGFIPNTPEALAQWIEAPRHFAPDSAMPDMGVSASDARLIAMYLSRPR